MGIADIRGSRCSAERVHRSMFHRRCSGLFRFRIVPLDRGMRLEHQRERQSHSTSGNPDAWREPGRGGCGSNGGERARTAGGGFAARAGRCSIGAHRGASGGSAGARSSGVGERTCPSGDSGATFGSQRDPARATAGRPRYSNRRPPDSCAGCLTPPPARRAQPGARAQSRRGALRLQCSRRHRSRHRGQWQELRRAVRDALSRIRRREASLGLSQRRDALRVAIAVRSPSWRGRDPLMTARPTPVVLPSPRLRGRREPRTTS